MERPTDRHCGLQGSYTSNNLMMEYLLRKIIFSKRVAASQILLFQCFGSVSFIKGGLTKYLDFMGACLLRSDKPPPPQPT